MVVSLEYVLAIRAVLDGHGSNRRAGAGPALLAAGAAHPALLPEADVGLAHACCGVVRNGCCDASAPGGAIFKLSAAPPPPKLAIACTS
jgi:hypothetical protein